MNQQEKKQFEQFKEFQAQQQKPKKKNKFLIGCLSIIVLIIVVSACNAITGGGSDTSNNNSKTTSSKKTEHKMNENVKVGKLDFKVTGKSEAQQVGSVLTNNAKGKFIILDVTVKNNGNEAVDIADSFFKIKSGDKTFEVDGAASTTANQAVNPDDLGFFGDKINPESEKAGKVVFDVAPNIAEKDNLVLQVQSGVFGTETSKIELK